MPVIFDTATKTAVMTARRDEVANGTLELLAANDDVLAIFGLDADGGTISGDTWTLVFDADTVQGETAASTGTSATKAQIKDSGGTARITGLTVGTSSADIIINNASIAEDQDVTVSSATVQHEPDPS